MRETMGVLLRYTAHAPNCSAANTRCMLDCTCGLREAFSAVQALVKKVDPGRTGGPGGGTLPGQFPVTKVDRVVGPTKSQKRRHINSAAVAARVVRPETPPAPPKPVIPPEDFFIPAKHAGAWERRKKTHPKDKVRLNSDNW